MRIARWMSLALAASFVIAGGELQAQTSSRRAPATPQRAPSRTVSDNVPTPRALQPTPASANAQRSTNAAAAGSEATTAFDAQVQREIQSMERMIQQATQVLERKMAQAAQVRQRGLEKEDRRLLDQAEQMERQAIAAYEQHLKQIESYTQRITATSQAIAEQTAKRANQGNVQAAEQATNQRPAAASAPARQPTPNHYYNYRARGRSR